MKIEALKNQIVSGGRTYPIFIAFIEAELVLKYSVVPNFSNDDHEEAIAVNIKSKPVKKWQRPLIQSKVDELIKTFNNTGEFMPNPVLLSENPLRTSKSQEKIKAYPKIIGGQTSSVWEISLPEEKEVLWIIDGQHRITGLGDVDCKQNSNIVPVVLLLNPDTVFYTPPDFAKIFAQVSTTASELRPLHKEWLQYSFELAKYEGKQWQDSMSTVVELCAHTEFIDRGTTYPNPYWDKIVFNDANLENNMRLNCQVFAEIIHSEYYNRKPEYNHFAPTELAVLVEKAFFQLRHTIPNPDLSVFFGSESTIRHVVSIKAYIRGILTYILKYCDPQDSSKTPDLNAWKNVYETLYFNKTDFNWALHSMTGEAWYSKSEILANVVFKEAFRSLTIPDGAVDLTHCICLGNNQFIELELTNNVGVSTTKKITSNTTVINDPGNISNIKIVNKSFNCELISIVDQKTTHNYPQKFNMDYARKNKGKGIDVPFTKPATKSKPAYDTTKNFNLEVKITRYGGGTDTMVIKFHI